MKETVKCKCGCETDIPKYTKRGELRRFICGHNRRSEQKIELIFCACGCGEKINRWNKWGRERRFVNNHAQRASKIYERPLEGSRALRKRNREMAKLKWPNQDFPRTKRKNCSKCGRRRLSPFAGNFDRNGDPLFMDKCIECRKSYLQGHNKTYRKQNRARINKRAVDRKHRRKVEAIAYLGGSCQKCSFAGKGREMTFHHRDRATKCYSVSQIMDRSWSVITEELDKCDLLCFRCHMAVEDQIIKEKSS